MVLLTTNMVLSVAALTILTYSEDRDAAAWLMKTIPASARSIALSWWIPASFLMSVVGTLTVLPLVLRVGQGSVVWVWSMLLITYACCTPIIGRLLPWNRRSPSRQLIVTFALTVMVGAMLYLFDGLEVLVGPVLASNVLFIPTVGLIALVGTGVLSAAIEWMES